MKTSPARIVLGAMFLTAAIVGISMYFVEIYELFGQAVAERPAETDYLVSLFLFMSFMGLGGLIGCCVIALKVMFPSLELK